MKGMTHIRIKLLYIILAISASFLLIGCGAGTSDTGFPTQAKITPTNGTISGILKLPTVADGVQQSKSRIRKAVSNLSDFSKFTIVAKYTENGIEKQVPGIVLSGGAYEILGVPFGKEVIVEAVLGKIVLKSVISELSTENVFADRNIDLKTTAQSVLYENIKNDAALNARPEVKFNELRTSETFIRNVEALASVLEVQVQDENFSSETQNILESSTVVNEINNVVQATSTSSIYNHLPYLQISQINTNQRGRVSIDFRVFDQEGDPSRVDFYYSTDNGVTFLPGNQSQDNFINMSNLAISSNDINSSNFKYNFFWESVADLQVGSSHNVIVKFDIYDAAKVSPAPSDKNSVKSVLFVVDNRGLPSITRVGGSFGVVEYNMGGSNPTTLEINGTNFSRVEGGSNITKVSLEYFGTEQAVSPRKYTFELGEFTVVSDNLINVTLPSIGSVQTKDLLFPVDYRVSVTGLEEALKSLSPETELLRVKETSAPIFNNSPKFLPASMKTDQSTAFILNGKHLSGVYNGGVVLKKQGAPSIQIPVTQTQVKMSSGVDPTIMEWKGQITSPVQTGIYDVFVKNACLLCTQHQIIGETYTVTEDAPLITNVSITSQAAFNNETAQVTITGSRLSSTSEVRISTIKNNLLSSSSYPSQLAVTMEPNHTFSEVKIVLPKGLTPGNYFVGVKNSSTSVGVSEGVIVVQEGEVRVTKITSRVSTSSTVSLPNPILNSQPFFVHIEGDSLASLTNVRFISSNGNYQKAPVSTSFSKAIVEFPLYAKPSIAEYTIELQNSFGSVSAGCSKNNITCPHIYEDLPVLSSFQRVPAQGASMVLTGHEVVSDEAFELILSGTSLIGSNKVEICKNPSNCPYSTQTVSLIDDTPSNQRVQASFYSQSYLEPGTYTLKLSNTAGSDSAFIDDPLVVVEPSPVLSFFNPTTVSSKDIQEGSQVVTFTGDRLFGVKAIYLFRVNETNPELTCAIAKGDADYTYFGFPVNPLNRQNVELRLSGDVLVPGRYLVKLENRGSFSSNNLGNNLSVCNTDNLNLQIINISEPSLIFNFFNDGIGSSTSTTTSLELTSTIAIDGRFLFGLDKVEFRLPPTYDSITNLATNYSMSTTGTPDNTSATFIVPSGLIPAHYDLYLKNASMSEPKYVGASVHMIEVSTPVIQSVSLLGQDDTNIVDRTYKLQGDYLDGVGLITKDIQLVDQRDPSNKVTIAYDDIDFKVDVDQSRYISFKVKQNTYGGDYFLSLKNSAPLYNVQSTTPDLRVGELKAVFKSLAVQGPFDSDYGFGENSKKLRVEVVGENLSSVEKVQLVREGSFGDPLCSGEQGPSSDQLILTTSSIIRNFSSEGMTLSITIPKFLRPGFWDIRLLNNSGQCSDKINPIVSPFFEQVLIREGAPKIHEMCEYSSTLGLINCGALFERNVEDLKKVGFRGENFYSLSSVRLFKQGVSTPDKAYTLSFGSTSSQILSHTSDIVALNLDFRFKNVGLFDLELTNLVAKRKEVGVIKSVEINAPNINVLNPSTISNVNDELIAVTGSSMTGTTNVAIWTLSGDNLVNEVVPTLFTRNEFTPHSNLSFTVPKGLMPDTYGVKVTNSSSDQLGFDQIGSERYLTIVEPSPNISAMSSNESFNHLTKVIELNGEGFRGVSEASLIPASSGADKDANTNFGLSYSVIPLQYSVTSRSLMMITIPSYQKPGYYRVHLKNTNVSNYTHSVSIRIREKKPVISSLTPSEIYYSNDSSVIISGSGFLGVAGTPASNTFVELFSESDLSEGQLNILQRKYDELTVLVPKNKTIGRHKIIVQNQEGMASSKTVTVFEVKEGLVELTNVTPTTIAYDADFTASPNRIAFTGKHLQGVKSMKIETVVSGTLYSYDINFSLCTIDPYVSLSNCPIETTEMFPGKYLLKMENSAGIISPVTPVFDITIPASTITNFSPNKGPFNAATKITLTGDNLRRFEVLNFRRANLSGSNDDVVDFLSQPAYPVPKYIDKNTVEVTMRSLNANGFNNALSNQFNLQWKTYGDATSNIFTSFKFVLDSNAPVITGFNYANSVVPWETETQFSDSSVVANLPTTSVVSGLDTTFTIIGENLSGANKVRIVREYDSIDFTVACTTGIFVNSNGASSATSLEITIPKSLFDPDGTYVDSCSNDTSVLPLLPGVYSFIIERNDGLKSNSGAGEFYFAEDQIPGGLDISILSSNPSNINTVRAKLTSSNSDGLFGLKQVSFKTTGSETYVLTIPRAGPVGVTKSRTLTEVLFDIPAQTLRGNKEYFDASGTVPFKLSYTINALNSRGWGVPVGNKLFMKEDEINISTITPKTAVNFLDTVVKVEGLSLFGVGKSVPVQPIMSFADYGGVNSFVLIHKESFEDNNLSTASIDLTTTVTKQTGNTLEVTIPKELRPGKWFIFAENDHSYSEPGLNPRSFMGFPDLLFDVVASSPIVTSVTPVLSTFDTLPTTMYITGQSLSGIRTAQLELVNSSTQFSKLLTLTSAPDFLASTYGSLAFTLPQSPNFLIPGDYQIHLGNSGEDVLVPMGNFKLTIDEKVPSLTDIVPGIIDNDDDVSIQLLGDNLFGNPKITITNSVDTILIDTSALVMSVDKLQNLTIPKSLFPQDWTLSIENSKGSTSKSFVVTEKIAKITSIVPNQVPFNARTPITIYGDHFIGAYSTLGSLRLTDEVKTSLEEIQLINRNEIRAVVPEGIQLGKHELQLATRSGINTTSAKLTIEGGGLNLVSITPNAGMATGNDFITISGTGFVQGSKVVIGGLLAWNVLAKENSLESFTPMVSGSEDMSGGSTTVSVYVINPDGAQSNSLSFTYLQEANKLPRLLTVYPGAMDIDTIGGDLNTKIAFKFSEPMNIDSLKAEVDLVNNFKAVSSFKDAAPMAGVIRGNSTSDVFVFEPVPGNNYQKNKRASIGFSSEIKSLQDENLIANTGEVIQSNSIYFDLNTFIEDWGFVPTATTVDNGNLQITSPSSVSSNVNLSEPITLEFNKFVNPLTIWRNDFVLRDMTAARILEVSVKGDDQGKKIIVDPQELLLPSHTYQLQVKSVRLESLTSNSMGSDQFLQLNTVQSGPKVLRTIPANHQTDLAVNANYIVEFDQSIDQITITSSNLVITNYLSEVLPWTYELDASKKWLTLAFDETLPPNQFVDVKMSRRIKSVVGVPLSEETTTNFKVSSASEADLSEPVVRFINPSNFASNVSTDATIIVSYSESIHPIDVNKEKFTLKRVVDGLDQDLSYTLTLDSNQKTVYLSAVNDLSYDSTYRVTAHLGVRDLFGNQSTISVGTQFTVTSFFDNFGPDLQSLTPYDGEEGVSITTTVVMIFNENLSPSTVIEDNFRLVHLSNYNVSLPKDQLIGTTLPAALNLIGDNQVRIASVDSLEKATYYMVEFTSDVKDQFGNNATPFRSIFKTEVRVDNVAPVITLLTVNDLPHHLNGDGNAVGSNSLVPTILVDGQGFTIDIYYEDPLVDGYASGVDVNTLRVTSEKSIAGVNPNENLVTKALQFGNVMHEEGHTRLYFPRGGAITFSDSLHTLTATIQDLPDPLTNNASLEAQYAFTVSDKNPVFPQDKLFYLDFSGDYFIQTPDVKLGGELTIHTEFKNPPANGVNDFDRDLMIMGLTIDPNSDQYVDDQRNIAYGVRTIVKAEILKESRKLFGLHPETGVPTNSLEAMSVRLTTNPIETISGLKSTIRIGGDNGQELDTTLVPQKVVDRSFYSSINSDAQLDLTARTSDRDSGLGVFVTHLIRRFANDSSASSDWNNRFGVFSPLGFSGSGGQSGQAIGTFLEDQHIIQYWALEESEITPQMMGEFHKSRFGKMKYAIRSFAKMVAVHVARVAAVGTGANAIGVPPQGYYGGVIDSSFFVASQTENYFLQPILANSQPDNNILRLDVDYNSHFNGIHFSSLAKNYLENRVTASPNTQGSAPAQISNVAATSGDGVVNLTWNADIDATQYNVYYGLNEQIDTNNFLGKVTFTNNAGTVTGLDNGLTYHFFVTGQNSQGEGPSSGFASATPSSASLFKISSTQLQSNTEMPVQFTCGGAVSPPLTFEGAPESTLAMVLIVKNTSTANSIWSVFNFSKSTTGADQATVPSGGIQGRNGGTGSIGYEGPCPSIGTTQFLDFELYALNASINLNIGATELEIRSAMNLHIIAQDTTSLTNVKITK
ncbi:MAG: Ig-like domain-containing protein [Candidatus Cloacimonetes bacterium]|nr:Ig-like domain-containing protein [Candidatus Cloacimonadota bacterium]